MKITFWGDSLTQGFPGVALLPKLRLLMPGDRIINRGFVGDTAFSLNRRIRRTGKCNHSDIAVLWIGANDSYVYALHRFPALKNLVRQVPADTVETYRRRFKETLLLLDPLCRRILVLNTPLMGEVEGQSWHPFFHELNGVMEDETAIYGGKAEFLDIRQVFLDELAHEKTCLYLSRKPSAIYRDFLHYSFTKTADKESLKRGQILTLDGLHFNSRGADLAADVLQKTLNEIKDSLR